MVASNSATRSRSIARSALVRRVAASTQTARVRISQVSSRSLIRSIDSGITMDERLGRTFTRPSPESMKMASRTGVRDRPNSLAMPTSSSALPGSRRRVRISSRRVW